MSLSTFTRLAVRTVSSVRAFSAAPVAAAPSWANDVTETIGNTPMVRLNKVGETKQINLV